METNDSATLLGGITITLLDEQAAGRADISDPGNFYKALGKDMRRISLIVSCRGLDASFPRRFEDSKSGQWYTLWDAAALGRRRHLCCLEGGLDVPKLERLERTGKITVGDSAMLLRELIAAGFTTDPNLGMPLLDPDGALFQEGWESMGELVTRLNKANNPLEVERLRGILTDFGRKLREQAA